MPTKPDTLVINSYGGSLTLAAHQEGHRVVASYEDVGFGLQTQRLNFPELDFYETDDEWPLDVDLRDAIVIAHPPCSAFSTQNRSKKVEVRGIESNAFNCTKRVLDFAMVRRARAIAIESVPGALEGARVVHDHYAKAYGYNLYRVTQNAVSFGVPQWRKRFWALFARRDANPSATFKLTLRHAPRYVGDVLPDARVEQPSDAHLGRWKRQVAMIESYGYDETRLRQLLSEPPVYANLVEVLARAHGVEKTKGWPPFGDLHKYVLGGNFLTGSMHVLDPNGLAPTLLGSAFWWYRDRLLALDDYKLLMGFPADYRYHKDSMTTILLSKGVCPPVARWILRELDANVFGITRTGDDDAFDDLTQHTTIDAGDVADFTINERFKTRQPA